MKKLVLVAAAIAVMASPGFALAKTAPKYDCTKPGNAKKAACKAAAVASAATTTASTPPAAVLTTSQPAKKPLLGKAPDATTTTTTATTAKGSTMKECATQWDALSPAQKDAYKTQATGMKSKKGGKLSGYNVFTGECLKKK
jgi:hypothetical protein